MRHARQLEAEPPPPAEFGDAEAAAKVGSYAYQALLKEVMLTPKPGLVDQRNSGAHRDMNLQMFLDSAGALAPWFARFVEIGATGPRLGYPGELLSRVRSAGLRCEAAMFKVTGGVNTHKGAIFSLGLLCSAAGLVIARGDRVSRSAICAEVAVMCTGLVERELVRSGRSRTAGERIFTQHGLTGARGEAESGYATVRATALPAYDALRCDGISEDLALLQTLLELLAANGDTNLVSRGGLPGLQYVQRWAADLLAAGGALASDGLGRLAAFDDDLIARNLSPSGSADLLAVTWFLAQFPVAGAGYAPADQPGRATKGTAASAPMIT